MHPDSPAIFPRTINSQKQLKITVHGNVRTKWCSSYLKIKALPAYFKLLVYTVDGASSHHDVIINVLYVTCFSYLIIAKYIFSLLSLLSHHSLSGLANIVIF